MMSCMVCGKGIPEGVALFRQNPKGEAGIWACEKHSQERIDPEVKELTDLIGGKTADMMDQPVTEAEIAHMKALHKGAPPFQGRSRHTRSPFGEPMSPP